MKQKLKKFIDIGDCTECIASEITEATKYEFAVFTNTSVYSRRIDNKEKNYANAICWRYGSFVATLMANWNFNQVFENPYA